MTQVAVKARHELGKDLLFSSGSHTTFPAVLGTHMDALEGEDGAEQRALGSPNSQVNQSKGFTWDLKKNHMGGTFHC